MRQHLEHLARLGLDDLGLDGLLGYNFRRWLWFRLRLRRFDTIKRDAVLDAYQRYGSIRKAAAALGIAKSTFGDYCKRYGIRAV